MSSQFEGASNLADGPQALEESRCVVPFEFRHLSHEYAETVRAFSDVGTKPDGETSATGAYNNQSYLDAGTRDSMTQAAIEAARQAAFVDGEREGRRATRVEIESQIHEQTEQQNRRVGVALGQFRDSREKYFADIEQEIVKLALAIASRILHREAQIDPVLLAGAVRVALEKMADKSAVALHVSPADAAVWELTLAAMPQHDRPRVIEDAHLERGDCKLETSMGTVELGVQIQLEEIEKGFFDLLNHRPSN